jgi:cytochrome b561
MQLRNTKEGYGAIARAIHWLMAVAIVAMFALGLYMRSLGYYDPLYHQLPHIHKSVGLILLAVLALRLGWKLIETKPQALGTGVEARIAHVVHWGFYPLLLALMASGYLISTAKGQPVAVFDWLSVPALVTAPGLAETAGEVHEWLAWGTIALATLHAAAALKHHLIDRDDTLLRMLRGAPPRRNPG